MSGELGEPIQRGLLSRRHNVIGLDATCATRYNRYLRIRHIPNRQSAIRAR
jgi:hypothetical protein